LEGAKTLVAFSSGRVAKGGPVKKISKKGGLIDIARVFSDDESSDETPTSPTRRSLDLLTAPILSLGADGAGGSAAAGVSASAERIVTAAARIFDSPPRQPVASPMVKTKGKGAAAETSASEYSLAAPHFASGDFKTRADLIPFVEGVSNLVLPASTPSLFTELNEFDEGCCAIKSLAVRVCFFSLFLVFPYFFTCPITNICSLRCSYFASRSLRLTVRQSEPCGLVLMDSKTVFGPRMTK
jgi:hypothetical protein